MAFLILALYFIAAYLLQLHALPVWGWDMTTPELLIAACAVGCLAFGPGRTLPYALIFGAAADLALGYGYGMFLLPMAAAAFFFAPFSEKALEKPWLGGLAAGGAGILARLFRACIGLFLGRGFLPAGREWLFLLAAGLFTALCAWILLLAEAARRRRIEERRYRL